jgi:MFS superfamily sulfate permease-like transporter
VQKTPLALVFASVAIAVCLLFLTDVIANLPNVVLAAIVLVAVKGLVDIPEIRRTWQLSRLEFWVAMAAFSGVLLLGILKGVLLATIVSMLLLIHRTANPHVARLGRVPGTRRYSDCGRHADNEAVAGRADRSRRGGAPVLQRGTRARRSSRAHRRRR